LWHAELKVSFNLQRNFWWNFSQGEGSSRGTARKDIRRCKHSPISTIICCQATESLTPPEYALFTRIYFLATANQTHADAPANMPGHQLKQKDWFGGRTIKFILALFLIPGTLSLIKDNDVFIRRFIHRPPQTLVEEIIDVLDSSPYIAPNLLKSSALLSLTPTTIILIASKRFP